MDGSARCIRRVAAEWDIRETVAAFELDLDDATADAVLTPLYEDVTSFPEVREDLAVVVSERVTAAEVLEVVRRAVRRCWPRAEVFDVYRDPELLGAGNVSLALRLAYRAPDRTLTDEEVAERRAAIVGGAGRSSSAGGSVAPSVSVFGARRVHRRADRAAAATATRRSSCRR